MSNQSLTRKKGGKIGKSTSKGCLTASSKRCASRVTKLKPKLKTLSVKENGKLLNKEKIYTHSPDQCAGQWCCVHNPSNHHMRTWNRYYRVDKGFLLERICPKHGVGHPDPDSLAFFERNGDWAMGVHGCCGCCRKPK